MLDIVKKYTLTQEAIKEQMNDWFVKEAISIYGEIEDEFVKSSADISTERFMKRRQVNVLFDKLDLAIQKRFGITFIHISTDNGGYACIPTHPKGYHVLVDDLEARMDSLNDMVILSGDSTVPNVEDIHNFESSQESIVKLIIKNQNELNKVMNTGGVLIDEGKATINGLGSEIKIFLLGDIVSLLVRGMSPEHLTAILLHEIGHGFTHISESYKSVAFTDKLISAVMEASESPAPDRFRMVNKKLFGGRVKLDDKDSEEEQVLKFQKKILANTTLSDRDTQHYVESERMADEFASKFGMGGFLADALDLLTSEERQALSPHRRVDTTVAARLMVYLFFTFSIVTLGAALLIVIAALAVYMLAIMLVVVLVSGSEKSRKKTYDVTLERYRRIYQTEIQRLRTIPATEKEIHRTTRANIADISKLMTKLGDKPLFEKLGGMLPWGKDKVLDTEILREVEDMIDNRLHVTTYDWKQATK